MSTEYKKPLPVPENFAVTRPFWEAAKNHVLVIPRCKRCSNFFWYPREQCPNCFSQDLEWVPVSGKGRVYSFTIVHQAADPAFQEEAPHVLAVIELDEGVRMISSLVDCAIEDARVDMQVMVSFDDVTPDWTLTKFKPV